MKAISKEDAKKMFKRDLEVGQYEIITGLEGGAFDIKLNTFKMEVVVPKTVVSTFAVVEDHYVYDGNGD